MVFATETPQSTRASPLASWRTHQSPPERSPSLSTLSLGFEFGAARAYGAEETTFGSAAPELALALGVQVDRHVRLEALKNMAIGAAAYGRRILLTNGGVRASSDNEEFLLLGARAVLPARFSPRSTRDDVFLSIGGGWAYASYSEKAGDVFKEVIYVIHASLLLTGKASIWAASWSFS